MYSIEKTNYGYKLVFGDFIKAEEMAKWVEESRSALLSAPDKFGVFIDMRTLKPLMPDAKEKMQEGQKLFKEKGMERSVVILNNPIITLQFKEIGQKSGIYTWERYIDASTTDNWEQAGVNWLVSSTDPDLK